ncbi:MAG TPA: PKD domain-containing protein [Luteibaculaceae bacterium]|nr:PKD domain-containing protein [Luteibaculaceae bacterium]
MKKAFGFLFALFLYSSIWGQIQFVNPSFEGTPGTGITPAPWILCGSGTPDTGPMQYNDMAASNGNTYLGLWNGSVVLATGEGTTQRLTCPLIAGKTYTFEIDLTGYSPSYQPGNLCIYGSNNANCSTNAADLLWRSNQAGQTAPGPARQWKTYTVTLRPTINYAYLTFWSCDASATGNQYVSFDNIKPISQDAVLAVTNGTCTTMGFATLTPPQTPNNYTFQWLDSLGNVVSTSQINSGPLPPGRYTVRAVDPAEGTCGIPIVKTFVITGPDKVDGTLTVDRDSVCGTGVVNFTFTSLNPGANYNFSWTGPVTNPNQGSTSATVSATTAFTLTVSAANDANCNKQFTQTIVYTQPPQAGNNATQVSCSSGSPVDLFALLGPTAQPGGRWLNPSNSSYTPPLNPATDQAGNYTYIIEREGCPSDSARISVSINSPLSAGPDNQLDICSNGTNPNLTQLIANPHPSGRWSGMGISASSGILNLTAAGVGQKSYSYVVTPAAPCPSDTAMVRVNVLPAPSVTIGTIPPFCQGTGTNVPITVNGNGPFTIKYQIGSVISQVSNINNSDSIPINPNADGTFTILEITDTNNPTCSLSTPRTAPVDVLTPPRLSVDSIACTASNLQYRVYMKLSGGNTSSYTVNGIPVASNVYVGPPINSGNTYNYVLNDNNNCQPLSTVSGIKICDCITDAGTMPTGLLTICGNQPATASPNADAVLDGNDVINYILHDGAGRSLGTIFAINKTSTSFYFDSVPGLMYNTRYYISRVIGNASATDPLLVDLNNPDGCLSVSAGQPVYFGQIPDVVPTFLQPQYCIGDTAVMVFNFTSGLEDYRISFSNGLVLGRLSPGRNTYRVPAQSVGILSYTLTAIADTNGCQQSLNKTFSTVVVGFPDTSQVSILCTSTNEGYQVRFQISGGDTASYAVNNAPTGLTFTSPVIDSGNSYDFSVTDKNQCRDTRVRGSFTCPCVSFAGDMTAGPSDPILDFCVGQTARATHRGNFVFDGNDTISYILTRNPNNPLAQVIQFNGTPEFNFVSGMQTDSVYFICPVVADANSSGLVNLAARCINARAGTRIRFRPLPTVAISNSSHVCQGDSATINIAITGNGPVQFVLRGSDGTTRNISGIGVFSTKVLPAVNQGVVTYSVDAGIFDATLPTPCSGSWVSAPVQVFVHPTPTASISGNFTLCLGQSINLPIVMSGDSVLRANYASASFNSFVQGRAGTFSPLVTPTTVGTHQYTLTSVVDNTPAACVGTTSGVATVVVRALPTASIAIIDPQVCRGESSGPSFTLSGFAGLNLYYRDNQNQRYVRLNQPQGAVSFPYIPEVSTTFFIDSITDATVSSANNRSCITTYGTNPPSASVMVNQLPIGIMSGDTGICRSQATDLRFNFTQSAPASAPYSLVYEQFNRISGLRTTDSLSALSAIDTHTVMPTDSSIYTPLRLYDRFGCRAQQLSGRAVIDVNPIPIPIIAASDSASCPPLITQLINLTDPRFNGSYRWDFGDGTQLSGSGAAQPAAHTYPDAGAYSVTLSVTSAQGCSNDTTINNFLVVHPLPTAAFNWSPQPTTILEPELRFFNLSTLNDTNQWTFRTISADTLGTSMLSDPSFLFPEQDSGTYRADLKVTTRFGCTDSTAAIIRINGVTESFIPSAFTPNGDGVNDVFLPIHLGEKPEAYEMSIFNRWGERLFYSTNPYEPWDGTYQGEIAKSDTYMYLIRVRSRYSAKKKEYRGRVNLID